MAFKKKLLFFVVLHAVFIRAGGLHDAAWEGDYGKVNTLIEAGHDVNDTNDCHDTPIVKAALAGHCRIVELFFQRGARVDTCDRWGNSLLHIVSAKEQLGVIPLLLEWGANLQATAPGGNTPLHVVPLELREESLTVLLSHYLAVKSKEVRIEARRKTIHFLLLLKRLRPDLPRELTLTILSFVPAYIFNDGMLKDVLTETSEDRMCALIQHCPDEWLMKNELFVRKMGGREGAIKTIAECRMEHIEQLIAIRNNAGKTPADKWPVLQTEVFNKKVQDSIEGRLRQYTP